MAKLFKVYRNFNKGLNDSIAEDVLYEQELAKAQNITLTSRGGYYKRDGCKKSINLEVLPSSHVSTQIRYATESVSQRLCVCNNTLYKIDSESSITSLKTGLAMNKIDFQFFSNSNLYFLDGTDYMVYDGTSVSSVTPAADTSLAHIKRCTIIEQRGQRLFCSGDPQNPNYIYYSEIGEPNNFPAANTIKAVSDDGDHINALIELNDKMIAFKEFNIYVWSGWDPTSDVTFDRLPIHTGTKSPKSLVRVDNMIIFLSQDSIIGLSMADNGYISVLNLGMNLENTIASLKNKEIAEAVYYQGSYLLACCDNENLDYNNIVLRGYTNFSYSTSSDKSGETKTIPWTTITGWRVSSWFHDLDGKLYYGNTGMIYEAFVNKNDDGQPIIVDVIHRFNLADSFRSKKIKSLIMLVSQVGHRLFNVRVYLTYLTYGSATDIYDVNLNDVMIWGVTPWGTEWGSYADILKKEIRLNKDCDRFELRLTQNEVNASTENDIMIYGFGIQFRMKRPKGQKSGISVGTTADGIYHLPPNEPIIPL
jgi:hypothetical protein